MSDNAESLKLIEQALREGWPFTKLCLAMAGDRVLFPRSQRPFRAEMIRRMAAEGIAPKAIAYKVGCTIRNVQKAISKSSPYIL